MTFVYELGVFNQEILVVESLDGIVTKKIPNTFDNE